jgi:hypothetical protein
VSEKSRTLQYVDQSYEELEARNKLLERVLEAAEVFMKIAYRKTNECIDLEDAVRAARENEKEG